MSTDMTYCANDSCNKRYKCERFRELPGAGKGDFWFAMFKPESCPERNKMNIWENKYYEEIEKATKYHEILVNDYITDMKIEIERFLRDKISEEDMDKLLEIMEETASNYSKRR